jgi:hypothetical protein
MDLDRLREFQRRGRFFSDMFPGAKASEKWLAHRDQLERDHERPGRWSPAATTNEPTEKSSDSA